MSLRSDKIMIELNDRLMTELGNKYYSKERLAEKFPKMADKMLAEMDEIEKEQEKLNSSTYNIMRRYTTVYNRGSFTCTNNSGSFTIIVKDN